MTATPEIQFAQSGPAEEQRIRKARLQWWVLAVIFTVVCTAVPFAMKSKWGSLAWMTGCVACGVVLGLLSSRSPWRWGVMMAASFTLTSLFVGQVPTISDMLGKLQFGVALSIPAFIGCYAGAFVRKVHRKRILLHGEKENAKFWKIAVAMGAVAGVASVITTRTDDVPWPAMSILFAAATICGYLKPERLWRWALALMPWIPIATILKILVDVSRHPDTHNLFPVEIGFAVVLSAIPVLSGTMLGRLLRTNSIKSPASETPSHV